MKLVIDIPEWVYEEIKTKDFEVNGFSVDVAIMNGTLLPENATNGDVIKAVFPNAEIEVYQTIVLVKYTEQNNEWVSYSPVWWNAPYEADKEE